MSVNANELDRIRERAAQLFLECYRSEGTARRALLDAACGGDTPLREAVEELLQSHDRPSTGALNALESGHRSGNAPAAIGGYRVTSELGRGGMGVVYRAEQQRPHRTVALKVLQAGLLAEVGERFRRETEFLAQLQHPGIAQVFDAGSYESELGELPYFTMELVDGPPIDTFCAKEALDTRALCELIVRLCDAVQHAHDRGIVHRDLKPGNILVTAGPHPQPKVLDFGIARSLGQDAFDSVVTRTGSLVGTLPYMSPEQVQSGRVDHRTDVYSLGVIAYELFAGRLPFDLDGLSVPEKARTIKEVEPTPLGSLDPALRGDLETITGKALEKSADRRYQSVAELRDDLRRFLDDEPIHARPPSTIYRLKKLARRRRGFVMAAAVAMLTLIAGVAFGALAEPPETSDARSGAERLAGTGRFAFDLEGATLDLPSSTLFHNGTPPANLWFRWTAERSGAFRVAPLGRAKNADTFISVHEGAQSDTPIGLSHRSGSRHEVGAAAVFHAVAGREYWINVLGSVNLRGEAELTATEVKPVVERAAVFREKTYLRIARCNWPTAAVRARALGGQLVTIGDAEELAFVRSLQDGKPVWIGAHDAEREGEHVWTDGTPVALDEWAEGQPDDRGLGEDYLRLDREGKLCDAMGSAWHPAIVELPAGAEPPATGPRRIGHWTVAPQGAPPRLARVGDFDGDGYEDFVVGYPGGDWNGAKAGWISVRSGRDGEELAGGFAGEPGDQVGSALAGADFDGDGHADVIYGARGWRSGRGRLAVLDGRTRQASHFVSGVTGTHLGVGDFDGDEFPDVVAQTKECSLRAFSVHGRRRLWQRDLAASIAALDVLGDVDGDGVHDLVVGLADHANGDGRVECLSGRDGETLWSRKGHNGERFGSSVATVGDVDGDGVADAAIGMANRLDGRGGVVLASGRTGMAAVMVTINGHAGERLGRGVAAAGDVDGDGTPDFACWGRPADGAARIYLRSGRGSLSVLRTVQGKTGSLTFVAVRNDRRVLGDAERTSVSLFGGSPSHGRASSRR